MTHELDPISGSGRDRRDDGILLIQVALAVPILLLGAMGFFFAFQSNFKATQEILWRDLEIAAFDNALATLNDQLFDELFTSYQGGAIVEPTPPSSTYGGGFFDIQELASLRDAAGNPSRVAVQFFVDETNLPPEFGPVLDIDGDGSRNEPDCSTTYQILPTRLTLTYSTPRGPVTRRKFVLLGPR